MIKSAVWTRIAKRLTQNAVFIFLFLVSCFLLLVDNAHAQSACDTPAQSSQEAINQLNKCAIEKDIFDDKIFNLNQITGTTDSLLNLLTGGSQLHPETNQVTAGGGALAASGNFIAALYSTPPVSGIQYFAGEIQKFNPVQPTYAQSTTIGFQALQPVQEIWTAFRNISYVGFVIVFVIIGFMIMFRAHISPQAVATIQDSVPRIVVALILVTFSYAIAGLMVDLMFVVLNVIVNTLITLDLLGQNANTVLTNNVFDIIFKSYPGIIKTVFETVLASITNVLKLGFLDDIIGFFGGSIMAIVAAIAILYVTFRIFLALLMAYVMVIILTIAAPFFFLIQALPGNNGAKEWFKQMAANVSVFPTVAIMFLFAGMLSGISALGGGGGSVQPLTGGDLSQFPLLVGGISTEMIGKLIGIGFLLMTPEAANMVKGFITGQGRGGGGAFGGAALGGAIGGALGAGYAPVGAALGRAGRAAWERGPIAERVRAGQIKRERKAYERAGWTMPGAPAETKPKAKSGGQS